MTQITKDLYAVLGLPRSATREQIRAAYRKRSKTAHPDAGGSEEEFRALQLAHTILTDEARRELYDERGEIDTASAENERAATLEILAHATLQILANIDADPATFDFLAAARAQITQKIKEGEAVMDKHSKLLHNLDTIIKRCQAKKKAADPTLLSVLASHRNQIASAQEKDKTTTARFRRALEFMEDYKYDFTAPQAASYYGAGTGGSYTPGSFFNLKV